MPQSAKLSEDFFNYSDSARLAFHCCICQYAKWIRKSRLEPKNIANLACFSIMLIPLEGLENIKLGVSDVENFGPKKIQVLKPSFLVSHEYKQMSWFI